MATRKKPARSAAATTPDRPAPRPAPKKAPDTAPPAPKRRALVWLAPEQVELVRAVADLANLEFTAVGAAPAEARMLAEALGGEPHDDLRHALGAADAEVALLASLSGAGLWELLEDIEFMRRCESRGLRVVSLEPAPGSLTELTRLRRIDSARQSGASFAPRMRHAPGFRAAADLFEQFGQVETMDLSARSGVGQGTLAARVFDAMDAVMAALGEPETIDASVRGPRSISGLRLAAGESLRDLRGDMTAHMRYADGRSAAVTLTDRGGRWFRGVTLLGSNGCLRIDEAGFEWLDATGKVIEKSPAAKGSRKQTTPDGALAAAAAIGDEINHMLDPRAPREAPLDVRTVLAMAEAAVLSARTGQPESPATLLRMTGAA